MRRGRRALFPEVYLAIDDQYAAHPLSHWYSAASAIAVAPTGQSG